MTGSYLFAFAVVIGLAVGSLWLLRLLKGRGVALVRENPIRMVAHRSIGAAANLVLVEVEGQRILLGVSRNGVSLIQTIADKPSAEVIPFNSTFKATLRRAGAGL